MVLGDHLDQPAPGASEQGEVLDIVEEALRLAFAAQHHLQ